MQTQTDLAETRLAIVQCLRLAYQRGLELELARQEKTQADNAPSAQDAPEAPEPQQ